MEPADLAKEIIANYQRHGWSVRRVLLRLETRAALASEAEALFGEAQMRNADFDALWFARPSHGDREAWELRLISEQPYALFQAFEADESEEDRDEARLEMENQMREHAGGK